MLEPKPTDTCIYCAAVIEFELKEGAWYAVSCPCVEVRRGETFKWMKICDELEAGARDSQADGWKESTE